jgi:hypothetical protein
MSTEVTVWNKKELEKLDFGTYESISKNWLEKTESGSELFVPVLSLATRNNLVGSIPNFQSIINWGIVPGGMALFAPFFFADALADPSNPWAVFNFVGVGFGGLLGVGAVTGTGIYGVVKRVKHNQITLTRHILSHSSKTDYLGLRLWLQSRYNLSEVPHKNLKMMVQNMYDSKQTAFVDASKPGRFWSLEYNREMEGWFVKEIHTDAQQELALVEAAVSMPASAVTTVSQTKASAIGTPAITEELSGECAVLLEGFQDRQKSLKNLVLSTESQHLVLRSQEDLRQGLALYSKMVAVGKPEEAAIFLGETLSLLIEELNVVLDKEFESLRSEFKTQHTYLKSRQAVEGVIPSALMLEAKAVDMKEGQNVI